MSVGATQALATELFERWRAGVPESVLVAAAGVVLDSAGCLFAGSIEPPSRVSAAIAAGGSPESSVVATSDRVDAPSAAFANGVAVHALDFEPIGAPPCHAPASVLPAVLALAESRSASGAEFLAAFALGWEVESRLRAVGRLRPSFHPLAVYGPVAAAAACAVLVGLDPRGIEDAISLAASSSGGLAANGHTPVKVVHAGSAARAGVVAALQAERGLGGARGVFEATGGYGDAFFAEADWSRLETWDAPEYHLTETGVVYKPYPVQLPLLGVVDAVLDARPPDFDPDALVELELEAAPLVASRSNPRPAGGHAAKFSAEFCAAAAMVFGRVGIDTFEDAVLGDSRVRAVIDRTRIVARANAELGAVVVRVGLRTGERWETARTHHRGWSGAPLEPEQRRAKLHDCLSSVGLASLTQDVVDSVEALPGAADLGRFGSVLRTPISAT